MTLPHIIAFTQNHVAFIFLFDFAVILYHIKILRDFNSFCYYFYVISVCILAEKSEE